MTREQITKEAVLSLFRGEKITASRGAELLGMSLWDFMDVLHANNLTLCDETAEELQEDLREFRRLKKIHVKKEKVV